MHANTSKYLGIYFKVKVTKSITSNKGSVVFAVFIKTTYPLLGINFNELNPYMLKHVWDTESDKFIMNLKLITILFLSEDLHFLCETGNLNGIHVKIKNRSHLIIIDFYVTLQEENDVYCKQILNHHHHHHQPPTKGKRNFLVL